VQMDAEEVVRSDHHGDHAHQRVKHHVRQHRPQPACICTRCMCVARARARVCVHALPVASITRVRMSRAVTRVAVGYVEVTVKVVNSAGVGLCLCRSADGEFAIVKSFPVCGRRRVGDDRIFR
jgi:hypothetical protein